VGGGNTGGGKKDGRSTPVEKKTGEKNETFVKGEC